MKNLWLIAAVVVLSGCATLKTIEKTNEALADLVLPPGAEALTPGAVKAGPDVIEAGPLTLVPQGLTQEFPNWGEALVTSLFLGGETSRWVETFSVTEEGRPVGKVRLVHDVSRSKEGGDVEWSSVGTNVVLVDPKGKVVGRQPPFDPKKPVALVVGGRPKFKVEFYFNGVVSNGGWADLLRQPTAFVIWGKDGRARALVSERGTRQLWLPEGDPAFRTAAALALAAADLMVHADPKIPGL